MENFLKNLIIGILLLAGCQSTGTTTQESTKKDTDSSVSSNQNEVDMLGLLNERFPKFSNIHASCFEGLEEEKINEQEHKKDSVLQQNFKGIGKFIIGSRYDSIEQYLLNTNAEFKELSGRDCCYYTLYGPSIEPGSDYPLLKGFLISSFVIADSELKDIALIFFRNNLAIIKSQYSNKNYFPSDKFTQEFDLLKPLLVQKYGLPLGYRKEATSMDGYKGIYHEYLLANWQNHRDTITIEIQENYAEPVSNFSSPNTLPVSYHYEFLIEKDNYELSNYINTISHDNERRKSEKEKKKNDSLLKSL